MSLWPLRTCAKDFFPTLPRCVDFGFPSCVFCLTSKRLALICSWSDVHLCIYPCVFVNPPRKKKLALRAGNEKEEGETADTVGCCSLRVEHVTLHKKLEGNKYVVELDFLGKDSIRYYNKVSVIKKVPTHSSLLSCLEIQMVYNKLR